MTPALAPFYTRWLRIEEAKLFADIALAGHDADAAWEVFRVEAGIELPETADEAGGFDSRSLTEIVVKPRVQVPPGDAFEVAKGGPTGMGRSDSRERPAPISEMDGDAIGAVKGAVPTAGRHWRRTVAVQTIQESERSSKPAADLPAGSGTDEIPAPIPITKHIDIQPHRSTLRPLCLHPENCGGYGAKTCHACLVAAGKTEAA
jgi:hypothetical protein